MNRADLVAALELLLAPIPVVEAPLEAVMAPAFVLRSGSPYRSRPLGLNYQTTWELLAVAGRTDDQRPYDTADELANLLCTKLDLLPNMTAHEAANAPAVLAIGGVDFVCFVFSFTDHNATGPCVP